MFFDLSAYKNKSYGNTTNINVCGYLTTGYCPDPGKLQKYKSTKGGDRQSKLPTTHLLCRTEK